jgi:hypothetical protein
VRSMTFAEFLGMPAGTLFAIKGMDPFDSIYSKRGNWQPSPSPLGFLMDDLHEYAEHGDDVPFGQTWLTEYDFDDDHQFLVYERADLDRLAGLVERARVVGRGDAS